MGDVIPFPLESCFVFPTMPNKHVIREFKLKVNWPHLNYVSSFNGETFKTEVSSKFPHSRVLTLGSYRNLPFVTGSWTSSPNRKTEILNYGLGEWEIAADYPFSNSNQYVSRNISLKLTIMKNNVILYSRQIHILFSQKEQFPFQNLMVCYCFNQWKCSDHRRLYEWFTFLLINNRRIQKWKLEKCWKLGSSSPWSWCNHIRIHHNGGWWLSNRWRIVSVYRNVITL